MLQRGTARAESCTHDALCGGEEAYGCRATNRASAPIVLADNQSFGQRDSIPTASTAEFESQSSLLQKEDDTPIVKVPVRLESMALEGWRATFLRSNIQVQSRTHICELFVVMKNKVRKLQRLFMPAIAIKHS